jgi:hypothetical protein
MRVLKHVAFQPGLAVAHIAVPHIGYVDWKALRSAGVKGVVFDKGKINFHLSIPLISLVNFI